MGIDSLSWSPSGPLVELQVLSLSGCVAACNTHMI